MAKVKLELHVHTEYSYDSNTSLEDIIKKCLKEKIDILAVTDHNQINGALILQRVAPFRVVVGEEILTTDGEVIGLFLKKSIPPGLSMRDTIKRIKMQGGVVYLPHPFDSLTRKTSIKKEKIRDHICDVDVVEIYNGRTVKEADNIKASMLAKRENKLVAIGSDAHTKYEIGRNYILMDDFKDSREFLRNLAAGELKRARVMFWPFVLTKVVRYFKRKKNSYKPS